MFSALLILIIGAFPGLAPSKTQNGTGDNDPGNGAVITLPGDQQTEPTPLPFGNEFESSGVLIQNVYNQSIKKLDSGEVLFADNTQFSFAYLPQTDEFIITILETPVDGIIHTAEATFVRTLAISHTEACKLKVSVGVPYFVDDSRAGKRLSLSFCE